MTPDEYVAHLLADWPPLTDDQLDRLAVLLRDPVQQGDGGGAARPEALEEAS